MGAVVLRGRDLLALGVHTLKNGDRPRDLIDQARRVVLSYIEEYAPAIVGIEKPLLFPTKRAALVSVIAQELHARSRDLGMRVYELSPREVRRIVVGNAHARKLDVARALVQMGFEDLRVKIRRIRCSDSNRRTSIGFTCLTRSRLPSPYGRSPSPRRADSATSPSLRPTSGPPYREGWEHPLAPLSFPTSSFTKEVQK